MEEIKTDMKKKMKKVKTKDNSYTFFSEEFQETYHSNTGAFEESIKKFVEPCNIQPGMKILDICFGLGYNSAAALNRTKKLKIIALENDQNILDKTKTIEIPYLMKDTYEIIRKAAKNLIYKDKNTEITIILGDAKETIKQINEEFDAVFFDPFSPKNHPEMWTLDFFKEIKSKMKKGAILTTYSCAGIVKRNLKEAGFEIKKGPSVGRRSPSTIAIN